jgi:hypothetical protein
MRWVKWLFWAAGVYGIAVVAPIFFLEEKFGVDCPPPVTHPEYYYGFAGSVLAWQLMYLLIGTDPARYRPAILVAIFAKAIFAITASILYSQGRAPGMIFGLSMVDAAIAVLFFAAWLRIASRWQS